MTFVYHHPNYYKKLKQNSKDYDSLIENADSLAKKAEKDGDLERKEYYMRNFSKKVSDNESNKNKIYISQSTSYAVR